MGVKMNVKIKEALKRETKPLHLKINEAFNRIEELESKVKRLEEKKNIQDKVNQQILVTVENIIASQSDYEEAIDLHKEYVRLQESACKDHIINEERIGDAVKAIKDDSYGEPELGSHDLSDDQQALDSVYGEDDHGVERL